jgi:hypothetical protein
MSTRFLAAALLAAGAIAAQTPYVFHPDDNTTAYTAPINNFPWYTTTTGYRAQTIFPASALLNVAGDITSIAPFLGVSTPAGTATVTYTVIQVTIGRAASPTLTTTFANNIVPGTGVQVLNLTNLTVNSPVNGWYDIPLQIPFTYTGGDLVLDVTTQVPSAVYFSSSVGGSTAPVPRLTASGLAPVTGSVSTSGGTKYRLGYNPINRLIASTTGNGAGDLTLAVQNLVPNATEGFLLISTDATHPLGTGPMLGLWPDALTWQIVMEPLALGSPFHFPCNTGFGLFPDQPLSVPAGSLSFLAGPSWDFGFAVFAPGFNYLGRSPVNRVVW